MGIQDRDYMKRRPEDDDRRHSSSGSGVEDRLRSFLNRNPRFFLYLGVALGTLCLLGLILAKMSDKN